MRRNGSAACARRNIGISIRLLVLVLIAPGTGMARETAVATPAPAHVVAELRQTVEWARQRFEARDAAGVLGLVSERYRSTGVTKAGLHQQLLGMFALYQEMRARVTLEQVQVVGDGTWLYTTGEIEGRLPFVGWVLVLAWQGEPEVARREAAGWRLVGFQD